MGGIIRIIKIQFGGEPFPDADALFERYRDAKVSVRNDPADPSNACLIEGWNGVMSILYILVMIFGFAKLASIDESDNKYLVAKRRHFGKNGSQISPAQSR